MPIQAPRESLPAGPLFEGTEVKKDLGSISPSPFAPQRRPHYKHHIAAQGFDMGGG
jgi:hypothetical protein